jgi:Ribosomal protein L7/L12 C-terminal domain
VNLVEPTIAFVVIVFVVGFVLGKIASGDHSNASRNLSGRGELPGISSQGFGAQEKYPGIASTGTSTGRGWPTIPEGFEARTAALLRDGKKIQAIKELRLVTGLGLAEAKAITDGVENGRSFKELMPGRYTNK